MRLRPSGKKGPVAVSLAAFEQYQLNEAWVWEHLALMRASLIFGDAVLCDRIQTIIAEALAGRKQTPEVLQEAARMRSRLADANAAERGNPWSLKLAAGGIMEIEFLAQTGALLNGLANGLAMPDLIMALSELDWLDADQASSLSDALSFQQHLQQIERIALEGALSPQALGGELKHVLVRAVDAGDFEDVGTMLESHQSAAAEICEGMIGSVEDQN